MAAKGHLTGHGHGQRIALYIQVVLGGFKTYELSKAKSSLFCAVFALAPFTVCQRKIGNLCIFGNLNHVVIC